MKRDMTKMPMAGKVTPNQIGTGPLWGDEKKAIPPNNVQRAAKDGSETSINAALAQAKRTVR
jgi:hypothetical protein